ncbi:hypothetical protein [Planococcus versutus]|uniref:Uncharacterized protein n=1 Tax=Planococcus versutus TaxID=1302659 RepID=A0A1B1S555_9BACL|nr:hypothetical protein [Planococcus versutus]ANU28318.1 hypothetical protein I858_015110 [Planococcus versutus]
MGKQKYNENVELLFVYTKIFSEIWKYYRLSEKDKKRFEKLVREYEETLADKEKNIKNRAKDLKKNQ